MSEDFCKVSDCVREAGGLLSQSTIYDLVKSQKLESVKIGGKVLIKRASWRRLFYGDTLPEMTVA